MTTRYQMKEMPDLQGTGEPITYPKMVMTGQTSTRELAEYIAMTSGFSKGDGQIDDPQNRRGLSWLENRSWRT